MKKIAYLASKVTLPGSPVRRPDAWEHDLMMQALGGPFASHGYDIVAVDWADTAQAWDQFEAALIGTTWDYWDHQEAYLSQLQQIEAVTPLFNSADLVRWNAHKGYLKDLEAKGARLIPTLWIDHVTKDNAAAAFETLGSDDLVFKRQVGAGAAGQFRLHKDDALPGMPHAMMVQPFLPAIQSEGEYSLIFIDGTFSHALIKRAKAGDYRIQSSYGGVEEAITPSDIDLARARTILETLDTVPLYARVDMLRADDGGLLLMELELIEPYLYPEQGPLLGERLADALIRRLS